MSVLLGPSHGNCQISAVTFDAKNSYSLFDTQLDNDDLHQRMYGQNYVLGLSGYGLHPRLLQFTLQTTFSDYSTTSRSISSEQNFRNRNRGYYNLSATFNPNNGSPLTFYASRTEESLGTTDASFVRSAESLSSRDVERIGLRWNIAKNTYYPHVELNLERNRMNGTVFLSPVSQVSDLLSVRMSNASDSGTSQYMFQYTASRTKNDLFLVNEKTHDFQFYGNATMADRLDLAFTGTYVIRDVLTNRMADINVTYRPGNGMRHQLKVSNYENLYMGSTTAKAVTNSVSEQTHIVFSDRLQGTAGVNVLWQKSYYGSGETRNDRAQMQALLNYNGRHGFVDLDGSVGTAVGAERYPLGPRKFIHQTQLSVGARTVSWSRLQLGLRDEITSATQYSLGSTLQNTVRVTATTDAVPRAVVTVEVSRGDMRYFDNELVAPRVTHSVGATVTSRLTPTTVADISHTQSWVSTWYREATSLTRGTVTQSGLFRDLLVQLIAERSYNAYTRLEMRSIEAVVSYRLYAFTIGARYSLRSVGRPRTQALLLEIQRPFAFDFR